MAGGFRVFHFASYLAFRAGLGLIRLLPIDLAFLAGKAGGELAYRILLRRRAIALRNLHLAFGGEMSEWQLRDLNRRHFQLLGANLLAGLKGGTLPSEKIWERVTVGEMPDERVKTGWIALISHAGSWELYGHLGRQFPEYRFGTIYQPLANPAIDRYLRSSRTRAGVRLFDRRSDLLSCVRFLREGGVVGVLADQGAGHAGLWTPLFGRLTSSSTLAARLSLRTGLPVVPIAVKTTGRARWQMSILSPMHPKHDDDTEVVTAKINRLLEQQIRRSPADWLWAHDRWKPLRPHILFARDQRRAFLPADFDRSTLDPFQILVVSPSSRAEAEASFPAVQGIKEGRLDNSVTILTVADHKELWQTSPAIDRILSWDKDESAFSIASKICAAPQFDVAISLTNDWRLSFAIWWARVPLRVGNRSGANRWLCNQHPSEMAEPTAPGESYLHIARSVGANV